MQTVVYQRGLQRPPYFMATVKHPQQVRDLRDLCHEELERFPSGLAWGPLLDRLTKIGVDVGLFDSTQQHRTDFGLRIVLNDGIEATATVEIWNPWEGSDD